MAYFSPITPALLGGEDGSGSATTILALFLTFFPVILVIPVLGGMSAVALGCMQASLVKKSLFVMLGIALLATAAWILSFLVMHWEAMWDGGYRSLYSDGIIFLFSLIALAFAAANLRKSLKATLVSLGIYFVLGWRMLGSLIF